MIQQQTSLKISDNSGAKLAKCIQCFPNKRFAKLGDSVVVTIKKLRPKARLSTKVLKGRVHLAIVTCTKKSFSRKDGSIHFSGSNAVVLLSDSGKTLATRALGPLPKSLRQVQFMKLASLSTGFV